MLGRLANSAVAAALVFGVGTGAALAGEWEFSGEAALELRYFPSSPAYPDQLDGLQQSVIIQPDLRWVSDNNKHEVVLIPFARLDGEDDNRTHMDLREGYYRFVSDGDWSLLAGVAKEFWGTTESRHLVDIINQTDGVEDIDEEDKLGQPMVKLTMLKDWGQLDLFLLGYARDRTFPDATGRLRLPSPVSDNRAVFTDDNKRDVIDYAARYSNYFGNWDLGLSAFHGVSREPRFAVPVSTPPELLPVYDKITQLGLDLQYTNDAWLWKFEGIAREGQGDTFSAAVAGVEYTLYQIMEKSWDLGVIAEYLYDGRDESFEVLPEGVAMVAPPTLFDNDVFLGGRLAFNDISDSAILAGMIVDVDDQSTLATVEAARRLGDNWTAELEARLFVNADPANLIAAFEDDDFLTLRLTRYY